MGGGRDKGVDAIFIDHETRGVYIIQGKYHQGSKIPSEKRSDIIALADLGRSLLLDNSEMFKALLNKADAVVKQALEDARSMLRRRNYRLILQFVTTGKVSPTHRTEAEQRIEDWETACFESFSRPELLSLMQDYIEGAAPPVPSILIPIEGGEFFKRYDAKTGITSWIVTVSGAKIGELFNTIGVRLFARNIRGYQGNTKINKGIHYTLKNEPEYFWYFNNGITIVCDEARLISKGATNNLRIANAQIINGQQTTRTLALDKYSNVNVLVKLIEIQKGSHEDGYSKYGHVVSEIVSATNWQNAISQSDLKSNDIEQVRIEREFRKLNYHYLRKKMSKAEARRTIGGKYRWVIKKEEIARSVGACVLDPYEVRSGKDRLFEDELYSIIFSGRSGPEYLNFYWLDRFVSYWGRRESRLAYARWIVVNFIWSRLGKALSRPTLRENFRRASERSKKYEWELLPLDNIAKSIFSTAMTFYRSNKRRDGKVLDEAAFFNHKNLHHQFEKFWVKQSTNKRNLFNKRLKEFINRLQTIE